MHLTHFDSIFMGDSVGGMQTGTCRF